MNSTAMCLFLQQTPMTTFSSSVLNLLLLQELPNSLQKSTTSWEPNSLRVMDRF